MSLLIPRPFKKILANSVFDGEIEAAMKPFAELYKDNKLFFFEDYTDHGIDHINQVLNSAAELLTADSWEMCGHEDVAALVMSVMLHDIGMHINYEGYTLLLRGGFDFVRIKDFDSLTWNDEWKKFIQAAKKYNQRELNRVLGSDWDPSKDFDFDAIENKKKNDLTGHDRKLIGEFFRKHHARLAHEIAIAGFPGTELVKFAPDLDAKIRDISGLIARSHNMQVRETFGYLKKIADKSWRKPFNIKAIFWMIVLRLSDYIQIHPERASKKLLRFRSLTNITSHQEWEAHDAITQIDSQVDDPEAIFINCHPGTSSLFLKLRKLIQDIQYEMDISWAALGEVYGNIQDLSKLKIRYRRISSNLDNITNFDKSVPYVPKEARFKSDNSLLNLLIAPLYGDNPTFGIRELLQNSIDACREREYFETTSNSNHTYVPAINISIHSEEKTSTFSIEDNGIGMNSEVIIQYFLKSGASFRDSAAWKLRYANEHGESQIERSGRFGIGVLGAFLIGNQIDVTTRKLNEEIGYTFRATINSEQIEIRKSNNAKIGTTIKIWLHNETVDILKKQWYEYWVYSYHSKAWPGWFLASKPILNFHVPENFFKPNFGRRITYPDYNDNLPVDMHSFCPPGYHKVIWWFEKTQKLLCNGIVIPNAYRLSKYSTHTRENYPSITSIPSVSVFDFNAALPLKLDRNELTKNYLPFEDELVEDLYKDLVAWVLTFRDPTTIDSNNINLKNFKITHPMFYSQYGTNDIFEKNIIFLDQGFSLTHSYCFEALKVKSLLRMWVNPDNANSKINFPILSRAVSFHDSNVRVIGNFNSTFDSRNDVGDQISFDRFLYLPEQLYSFMFSDKTKRTRGPFKKSLIPIETKHGWMCMSQYSHGKNEMALEAFGDNFLAAELLNIKTIKQPSNKEDSILDRILKRYLGNNPLIPYNIKLRKKKFPIAYKELGNYMAKYE